MSPTSTSSSTIYDHLMINYHQQPKMIMRNNTNASNNIYDNSNRYYYSNSKTDSDNLLLFKKTQSLPLDEQQRSKRRYTITHVTVPDPIVRCSVTNHAYDKAIVRKSSPMSNTSSTWKQTNSNINSKTNPKYFQPTLRSNIEVKPMDFRPLITNGRRRFNTISSAIPMIIIKKKSPSPMKTISYNQRPLHRSIPVNITSNNTAMVVSTVIPASLSYSSSCSSSATSTSSTNVRTVSVPIQVIKTQKNNNNNNISTSSTTSSRTLIENQKGYRYIQKYPPAQQQQQQLRPLFNVKVENHTQRLPILTYDDDDDNNESTKIYSSSSGSRDDNSRNPTIMTDSNVLRLIRRYDPVAAETFGVRTRRSLENTRNVYQTTPSKSVSSLPPNVTGSTNSILSQRTSLNSIHENNRLGEQASTPRLQRQQAIQEQEVLSPTSPPNGTANSIRPILKYIPPASRTELSVQPKKIEPLSIDVEPHVPPPVVNQNTVTYQPLITTGTKRVCAAISKSEWDLRLQHDSSSSVLPSPSLPSPAQPLAPTPPTTHPVQSASPRVTIHQQKEKESYRPLLGRSKSSIGINNDNNDQDYDNDHFDEVSGPNTNISSVQKLKQLFATKSSFDLTNSSTNKQDRGTSIESNFSQRLNTNGTSNLNKSDHKSSTTSLIQNIPKSNSIELQTRTTIQNTNLTKPTTIIQEAVPTSSPSLRRPILRSQKTFDSTEPVSHHNNNNNTTTSNSMPSSELSYDAYRFHRLNDKGQMTTTRLRNVAKVEPYSINTNMVRPLYQSSSTSQPTSTTVPSKGRNNLNSVGNTPTNSSTSSSAASLGGTIRHPNVRNSDFLIPNPTYSTVPPPHTTTTVPSLSNSSSSYTTPPSTSILLSESLSHTSPQRLINSSTTNNSYSQNGRSNGLSSSFNNNNNSPQKYQSSTQGDLLSGKQTYSPSTYHNGNSTVNNRTNNTNNNMYKKIDNYGPTTSYHYRPKEYAASTQAINTSLTNGRQQSQGPIMRSTFIEQQQQQQQQLPDERSSGAQQQQSRRRFQRRKQMKRSKSADLYQDHSPVSSKTSNNSTNNNYSFTSTNNTNNNESNRCNRQQRSISRDLIGGGTGGGDEHLSSSSSSSSIANIERINRAALLRYKSLDSMTLNNRKSSLNGKTNGRRGSSRPVNVDFDSDDSVCGIPKPRKLSSNSKNVTQSERRLHDSSSPENDRYSTTRAISIHDIGISNTSTGITNSIQNNDITVDQTDVLVESNPSTQLLSSTKTTSDQKEGRNIMQQEQQSKPSFTDRQFYTRSSHTPPNQRHDLTYPKIDEIYSSPPIEDTFHDAIEDFNTNKEPLIDDKNMPTKIYPDWNRPHEKEYRPNQELFIVEPSDVNPAKTKIPLENEKSTKSSPLSNSFERIRPLDVQTARKTTPPSPPLVRPLKSSVEKMQHDIDDSSISTTTTTTAANRSIHLPVEKQRYLSEIVRKRNSRYKVEDYKRSFQKSNTIDESYSEYFNSIPTSKSDYTLSNKQISNSNISPRQMKRLNKTKSVDMSIEYDRPSQISNKSEQSNSNENNEIDEHMTVSAKKSLFETFSKDIKPSHGLIRSKSFKHQSSSSFLPKKTTGSPPMLRKQESKIENDENLVENPVDVVHDDTSKLTFKEKMVLFNKKRNFGSLPSSIKTNRNRLTQPITAEEVQAAENLSTEPSPSTSSNQLATTPSVNDKSLIHDYSSIEDNSIPTKSILRTSTIQENRFDDEHAKDLSMRNIDDTNMMSPTEAENMIPVSKRLEQLKNYGENEWKKRVKSTNDANEFTVEGKLRQAGKLPTPTDEEKSIVPTSARKTPTLKYNSKKSNTDQEQRAKTVDVVRLKSESAVKTKDTTPTSPLNNKPSTKSINNNNVVSVLKSDTISVLKPDDHLENFFADTNKNLNNNNESSVHLDTDDLNRIAENAVRLQSQPVRVRPPRRQQQGAKNPLRQIQATIPTSNEYTEVHTNLSEQELRRLKRAQIAENAGLAQEALAALAATENFAEINLRKIDRSALATFGFEPYKDIMLMLIKGRRHCSLRLVNPTHESVNEGDCYLLITPSKVFAWIGRYANALEKAKTMDILDFLKQHRDFGLRSEAKYFLLDQGNDDTENDFHAEFADVLHGELDDFKPCDFVIDDDFYEANVMELNRVYRVDNDMLIPLEDFCFRSLSVKILDPNEVFVFDFGSELYVWNGKYADKIKRNMGLQLAQQLWNDAYDFSECLMNPFDPFDEKNEMSSQTGTKRPTWCIFGKQNQNVETLLFKGKFYDWPGDLKDLKPVNDAANNVNRIPSARRPPSIVEMLKPADVNKMLAKQDNPVNMILEQANLGRGKHWYDPVELRGHDVQTISLNVWHVCDNERHELSKSSYGQFHSDDVYIIRWRYKLVASGFHSIKTGQASVRKTDTGRDRVAYWIWQGINASPNEKGLSALMTVFLDEEKGPHVHVIQEHEEAVFLQLFDGTMTTHMGKRNQSKQNKSNQWRLYVFLGEIDVENHWWEINIDCANLRSRTSFLFINNQKNVMLLWHGCGTTNEQKSLANKSAMKLRERCSEEFHFNGESEDIEFCEMQEGDEIDLFWEAMNQRTHQRKYYSLLNNPEKQKLTATMRIFHLSSLHGPFVAQELIYLLRSPDHISSFPFTQADLYDLHQPALCLIDAHTEVYIWQGWNDVSDDELDSQLYNANVQAGCPRDIRFTAERRCAFRTAVEYCKAKTGSSTIDLPCSIVYAGLEPIDFINLFPKWTIHMKARQQNQLEGKKLNQKDSVYDILKQLCREQYTVEELRARPLPEGVDPSKIESYLSDEEFQKELRMTKDEFYALPYWKQTNIKKPLGFF